MPRGAKLTIDEKIARQEEVVAKAQAKLDSEIEILKSLQDKKNDEKKEELLRVIDNSGKSYDEILELLQKQN